MRLSLPSCKGELYVLSLPGAEPTGFTGVRSGCSAWQEKGKKVSMGAC